MRGIVLAGGTGSRLGALTKVINKHLLPVRGVPMVFHALKVLRDNGITDITIVSSPSGVGQLAMLLGGGYTYRVQESPGGIAKALLCAETASTESVAVILGDNVFLPSPRLVEGPYASVVLAKVADPSAFGVASLKDGWVTSIVEKPESPQSNFVVTGLYVFNHRIFAYLRSAPSLGEYELTAYLDVFAKRNNLAHSFVSGFWGDAGTLEGMKLCESW